MNSESPRNRTTFLFNLHAIQCVAISAHSFYTKAVHAPILELRPKRAVFGVSLRLHRHLQIARAAQYECSAGKVHRSRGLPNYTSVNLG